MQFFVNVSDREAEGGSEEGVVSVWVQATLGS